MKKVPLLLIYSRILLGVIIILLSILQPAFFTWIIITFIFLGLIADIFDGIIARHLNISTPKLRRLDSGVDQFFWLCIVIACYLITPQFFKDNWIKILILSAAEGLCYIISYLRFKKEVATHAIGSKLWTLVLFTTLIQLIATGNSQVLFIICFYLGFATRLEIIAILFIIKHWTNDIPTVYHAVLMRKGKPIKRHKLFNG
ncbi:CDP-alcohol phosphatidyltransferase family protein [Mucilaginibacter segetis]|nr:CDP-alcohol phosphatidyltransferase family protein [Mucilaginibacter segetis]